MAKQRTFLKKNIPSLLTGTLILTATGFFVRLLGFFYRIVLSRLIGAEGMGLYQLVLPVFGICFALCCGSIQTSISRYVAGSTGSPALARRYLFAGLLLAELLAGICFAFLFFLAPLLARSLINRPEAAPLLRLLALSLPISASHACLCGYYYGKNCAIIPSACQIAEQLARIIVALWLASRLMPPESSSLPPPIAIWGMLAGEAASLCLSVVCFILAQSRRAGMCRTRCTGHSDVLAPHFSSCLRKLGLMSMPLMANRATLGLMQSLEAAIIPMSLAAFGLSRSEALGIYGILTGMSLPFILFPSALTNSLSVLLLPAVSSSVASGVAKAKISLTKTVQASLYVSLYLGIFCCALFRCFGESLGPLIFNSRRAGLYIAALAWLCPFMYLTTTSFSVINGLGRLHVPFLLNLLHFSVRIAGIYFFVPRIGMDAYFLALLLGQLLATAGAFFCLKRLVPISYSAVHHLLRPAAAAFLGTYAAKALYGQLAAWPYPAHILGGCMLLFVYLLFLAATAANTKDAFL